MSKHILLTGATGLLGQYMLRDFLLQKMPTAVVVRSSGGESAKDRVEKLLAQWEAESGGELPRPVCLDGDITLPGLGLSADDRDWAARHCGPVLHNAASLTLFGKDRHKDPWLSNLTGTANMLDFCRAAGLRDLHYMSTAYVCGKRTGMVLESELDEGQSFNNDYEQCKCEAEKLVRAADFVDRLTVYRPGIIVGDSRTGFTSTYHGLYLYLRWVWLYAQALPRDADGRVHAPVRMHLSGDESCHIVPVDWVASATTYLLARPACHGRTYHLTQQQPLTAGVGRSIGREFQLLRPYLCRRGRFAARRLERIGAVVLRDGGALISRTWNPNLDFDSRNLQAAAAHMPCPRIDRALIQRLVKFAIEDEWGRLKKKPKTRKAAGSGK